MKLHNTYIVWITNDAVSEVASSHYDFIDAMNAAEKLIPLHQEVQVVFTARTLCKSWKSGREQVTREL